MRRTLPIEVLRGEDDDASECQEDEGAVAQHLTVERQCFRAENVAHELLPVPAKNALYGTRECHFAGQPGLRADLQEAAANPRFFSRL
jgi:hypothetical protein